MLGKVSPGAPIEEKVGTAMAVAVLTGVKGMGAYPVAVARGVTVPPGAVGQGVWVGVPVALGVPVLVGVPVGVPVTSA